MHDDDKPELTLMDRCDACGVAAQSVATHPTKATNLLFCGHHANAHGPALLAQGWTLR
jgi:hypothetical protein